MSRIPQKLRETIAKNIRSLRMVRYPGRGGSKKCAEDFGVSPQQWSPWESGLRTPDESRLQQIAEFFHTTVETMRRDQRVPGCPGGEAGGIDLTIYSNSSQSLPSRRAADESPAGSALVVEYHRALTRLLNQANKADLRETVSFLNSLADLLEKTNHPHA